MGSVTRDLKGQMGWLGATARRTSEPGSKSDQDLVEGLQSRSDATVPLHELAEGIFDFL